MGVLVSAVNWVSVVCLCLMMFLTVVDVFGRYLLNNPIAFVIDVTELLLVIAAFMALPYTQFIKGHIRVGLLIDRLSERTQAILGIPTSFLGAATYAFIAWQLGKRAWIALQNPNQYYTMTTEIPIGPFVLIAAIGSFLLCLTLFADFFSSLVSASGKRKAV
jgi:TRAP-type C4-dicarboxylate transport system permease small subunit